MLSNTIRKHKNLSAIQPERLLCERALPWSHGPKFKDNLKKNVLNGLSGNIQFENSTGLRTNLVLSIVDSIRNSIDLVFIHC